MGEGNLSLISYLYHGLLTQCHDLFKAQSGRDSFGFFSQCKSLFPVAPVANTIILGSIDFAI